MQPTPDSGTTPSPDSDDALTQSGGQEDEPKEVSEVALRLNLLGKLIIPPAAH